MNNRGKEKFFYAIIIVVIIAIFVGAYFLIDNFLFGKNENGKINYKQEISISEVEKKMNDNGLSKIDLSKLIKSENQKSSYIFRNTNKNYEIVYSNFNDKTLATSNFNENLNLLKGKYSDLVEITNIQEENYSKYEAENSDNYVVILKIGTSYFQVETSKDNKASVQGIISSLEG